MVIRFAKIYIVALLLVSCSGNTTNNNVRHYNLDDYQIVGSYDINTVGIINDAVIFEDYIILNSGDVNNHFHIIDSRTGRIYKSFGKQGRGPGEYIKIGRQLSISDSVLFFSDNATKELCAINLNKLLRNDNNFIIEKRKYPYTKDFRPSKFLVLKDYTICLGAIKDYRFGVIDNISGQVISHNNLYMPHSEFIDGIYVGSVYQSIMQSSASNGLFVISLLASDYFEIFRINKTQVECIFKSQNATMPKVHQKPKIGTNYSIDYEKSIAGNVNVAVTDKNIYFLNSNLSYSMYSAKGEAHEIKAFTWNGEQLAAYTLPFPVSRIFVDKCCLYCFRYDIEKVNIYRFDLREKLP